MDQNRAQLRAFIETHSEQLKSTLRLYALRAGLPAEQAAAELLSDVTVEALEHASRFDHLRHPMSWLLGIGANLIKRRVDKLNKLNRREPLVRDLYPQDDHLSDGELFDRITTAQPESDTVLISLLRQLAHDDRTVIQLAIMDDLDGNDLAQRLQVNPGTARMRLHRALRRLRVLYHQMENER